jgi:hypothetical protein
MKAIRSGGRKGKNKSTAWRKFFKWRRAQLTPSKVGGMEHMAQSLQVLIGDQDSMDPHFAIRYPELSFQEFAWALPLGQSL